MFPVSIHFMQSQSWVLWEAHVHRKVKELRSITNAGHHIPF